MVIKQINTLLSAGTNFKMDVYAIKSILFAQWNGVNVNILGMYNQRLELYVQFY